ncbi:MAG: hypothetical protein IKE56_00600 [Lachnospiraceae bacterium]|nr:hypothetical protein [Lachnospiraceae bacterium]
MNRRFRTIMTALLILLCMLAGLTSCGGSKVRADADLEGKYIAVLGEMLGVAMSDDLEGFGLELKSGGKGTITADGNSGNMKWENDDTTVTLTVDGEKMVASRGQDCLVFDDMLGMGLKMTFAKEGTAAADPALYLPESEKYMLRDWQSVSVTDILGDPVDEAEMAPDALKMTFHGDHTLDAVIEGKEYKGVPWTNLGDYGSVDSEEVKLTWNVKEDGLETDYVKDGEYYTFFCPEDPEAYAKAAAAVETEAETEEETQEETEAETEAEVPAAGLPEAGTGSYADYWGGSWYGWYEVESCSGEYEDLEGNWWDACAEITVNDDNTGHIYIWDTDGSSDDLFSAVNVTFKEGTTPNGCMVSESGSFWVPDTNIGHADWIVDPGASDVSAFDHMICIEGDYEDESGDLHYYIYLKPWGADWEDVRSFDEKWLPGTYDSWYVNVKDGEMPGEIGG